MSNFDFLRDFDSDLWKIGNRIEKALNVSPSAVRADATPFLERVLTILLARTDMKFNPRKEFYDQLDAVYRAGVITYRYKASIYEAYQLRNRIHDTIDEIEKTEVPIAHQLHKKLFYISKKLYRDFAEDYDDYKGVPQYKPVEIDTSDDEMELLEIPDFSEIIDIRYDYCVICGQPNHSNYSLCCHECNREMDNANNFISMRNSFGKAAEFTKEDLIEYGIPEGYANQLINSLVRENMLKVRGRYITFNNMHVDEYLAKIDKYIAICELITKFNEDKVSPAEIKQSREYRQGSFKQEPYYQFYKLVNREVVKKFEKYLLTIEDIKKSMEYTTITQKQLDRWYRLNLAEYKKGNRREAFVLYNDLMMDEYLRLKGEGMHEKQIRKELNVTDEKYDFWCSINPDFEDEIHQIKIDLITGAITEGRLKAEIIEIAGVTPREYDDIIKVAKFKNDEFGQLHTREVESRKENFIKYLADNDLETACRLAKFSLDDFYEYYDSADHSSDFYTESTRLLMDKYLEVRRTGKTAQEAIEIVGIRQAYLDRWLSRTKYSQFKDANLKITLDLILEGLKQNKSLEEIAETVDCDVNAIKRFIRIGERGGEIYRPLYEYYEAEIIPQKLTRFVEASRKKTYRKALEAADLTEDELNRYYELGKSGDDRYVEFYENVVDIRQAAYAYHIQKGRSHNIAKKESGLSEEEYNEHRDEIDDLLRIIRINIVLEEIKDKKTTTVAAGKANCSVDDIYEWYFRGRDGEEDYVNFYKAFHAGYVRPNINSIQEHLDYKNQSLENIIRANKDQITKKDVEIWVKNGMLENKILKLNPSKGDEDDDDKKSQFNANEMLREMGVEDYDRISIKKTSGSSGILASNDDDIEKMKKEILKKSKDNR